MKKLGFGFMRLPTTDPNDAAKVDIELVKEMTDLYMERGFTYFDTAHRYCDEASEPAIRQALVERYPRESFELTNKITIFHGYIKSEGDQEAFFQNQLALCGVEYFDNYLIHGLNHAFYQDAKRLRTFEFVQGLKDRGLCRRTGFSFHGSPELLEEILTDHPEVDMVQLQINYLDWEDAGVQSRKCYEIARRHGKLVTVMESVKGGNLANLPEEAAKLLENAHPGWSQAEWAIRFVAGLPGVYCALSGMTTLEQVEDNTGFMQDFQPLSGDDLALLEQAAKIIRSSMAVACTACQYCVGECPKRIAIPNYFALYNAEKRPGNVNYVHASAIYYDTLTKNHSKASACIKCGRCEKACPQHLPIREYLADVAEMFEGVGKGAAALK